MATFKSKFNLGDVIEYKFEDDKESSFGKIASVHFGIDGVVIYVVSGNYVSDNQILTTTKERKQRVKKENEVDLPAEVAN
jgi:hypothetical protein